MSALHDLTVTRTNPAAFERTPQRLDPLGVHSAWLLVPALSTLSVAYAAYSTLSHGAQIVHPWLAWWSIIALLTAGIVYSMRTLPGRAPFGRWSHLSVVAVVVFAAVLFAASTWGHNERLQDDWGQMAVALVVTTMGLYRPVAEVLSVGVAAAAILAVVAALQAPFLSIASPPLVYATVVATPIIALACAGAGYAWTMTGQTLAWRELAKAGQERLEPELRETALRMVNQETITTLNVATAPFLADLLERGEITDDDVEHARGLASVLRDAAVSAVDRTWLGESLEHALTARGQGLSPVQGVSRVSDPGRLERALTDEQRAILSAIISTVVTLPGLDPASVYIAVPEPARTTFELVCRAVDSRRTLRRELLPFLSALRSVGMNTSFHLAGGELTLRFSYA